MQVGNAIDGQKALAGIDTSKAKDLQRIVSAAQSDKTDEADERAGEAFEKYFTTMLVKELRSSLPGGFFDGAGSDIYTSWFDEHLGEALSSSDALGIAGLIKTSLKRMNTAQEQGLDAQSLLRAEELDKDKDQ